MRQKETESWVGGTAGGNRTGRVAAYIVGQGTGSLTCIETNIKTRGASVKTSPPSPAGERGPENSRRIPPNGKKRGG